VTGQAYATVRDFLEISCIVLLSAISHLSFPSAIGMRGRLAVQSFVLFMEGMLVIIFASSSSLASAIAVLVCFSCFVQAAEGTSFGIVPFINPPITGSISGIVGAGGNVGAVAFGFCFRQLSAKKAFTVMGSMIIFSSILSIFVFIPDHPGMLCRRNVGTEQDQLLAKNAECASCQPNSSDAGDNTLVTSQADNDEAENTK
jgi:hypothetical protein